MSLISNKFAKEAKQRKMLLNYIIMYYTIRAYGWSGCMDLPFLTSAVDGGE
jgi:hypothetical protein